MHFNVITGVPERSIVTDGRTSEYQTLSENVEADCLYVLDRAYHCYQAMADILAAGSELPVRLRADMKFDAEEEHPPSVEDRLAGVACCQTVRLRGLRGTRALQDIPLKLIEFTRPDGRAMRLLTNRVDLDPDVVGVAYRYRWQVELLFRSLKCLVNCRHVFSESANGVALQIAAALFVTLLIALETGARPSVFDYAMMTHVMSGLMSAEGVERLWRDAAPNAPAQSSAPEPSARKRTNSSSASRTVSCIVRPMVCAVTLPVFANAVES